MTLLNRPIGPVIGKSHNDNVITGKTPEKFQVLSKNNIVINHTKNNLSLVPSILLPQITPNLCRNAGGLQDINNDPSKVSSTLSLNSETVKIVLNDPLTTVSECSSAIVGAVTSLSHANHVKYLEPSSTNTVVISTVNIKPTSTSLDVCSAPSNTVASCIVASSLPNAPKNIHPKSPRKLLKKLPKCMNTSIKLFFDSDSSKILAYPASTLPSSEGFVSNATPPLKILAPKKTPNIPAVVAFEPMHVVPDIQPETKVVMLYPTLKPSLSKLRPIAPKQCLTMKNVVMMNSEPKDFLFSPPITKQDLLAEKRKGTYSGNNRSEKRLKTAVPLSSRSDLLENKSDPSSDKKSLTDMDLNLAENTHPDTVLSDISPIEGTHEMRFASSSQTTITSQSSAYESSCELTESNSTQKQTESYNNLETLDNTSKEPAKTSETSEYNISSLSVSSGGSLPKKVEPVTPCSIVGNFTDVRSASQDPLLDSCLKANYNIISNASSVFSDNLSTDVHCNTSHPNAGIQFMSCAAEFCQPEKSSEEVMQSSSSALVVKANSTMSTICPVIKTPQAENDSSFIVESRRSSLLVASRNQLVDPHPQVLPTSCHVAPVTSIIVSDAVSSVHSSSHCPTPKTTISDLKLNTCVPTIISPVGNMVTSAAVLSSQLYHTDSTISTRVKLDGNESNWKSDKSQASFPEEKREIENSKTESIMTIISTQQLCGPSVTSVCLARDSHRLPMEDVRSTSECPGTVPLSKVNSHSVESIFSSTNGNSNYSITALCMSSKGKVIGHDQSDSVSVVPPVAVPARLENQCTSMAGEGSRVKKDSESGNITLPAVSSTDCTKTLESIVFTEGDRINIPIVSSDHGNVNVSDSHVTLTTEPNKCHDTNVNTESLSSKLDLPTYSTSMNSTSCRPANTPINSVEDKQTFSYIPVSSLPMNLVTASTHEPTSLASNIGNKNRIMTQTLSSYDSVMPSCINSVSPAVSKTSMKSTAVISVSVLPELISSSSLSSISFSEKPSTAAFPPLGTNVSTPSYSPMQCNTLPIHSKSISSNAASSSNDSNLSESPSSSNNQNKFGSMYSSSIDSALNDNREKQERKIHGLPDSNSMYSNLILNNHSNFSFLCPSSTGLSSGIRPNLCVPSSLMSSNSSIYSFSSSQNYSPTYATFASLPPTNSTPTSFSFSLSSNPPVSSTAVVNASNSSLSQTELTQPCASTCDNFNFPPFLTGNEVHQNIPVQSYHRYPITSSWDAGSDTNLNSFVPTTFVVSFAESYPSIQNVSKSFDSSVSSSTVERNSIKISSTSATSPAKYNDLVTDVARLPSSLAISLDVSHSKSSDTPTSLPATREPTSACVNHSFVSTSLSSAGFFVPSSLNSASGPSKPKTSNVVKEAVRDYSVSTTHSENSRVPEASLACTNVVKGTWSSSVASNDKEKRYNPEVFPAGSCETNVIAKVDVSTTDNDGRKEEIHSALEGLVSSHSCPSSSSAECSTNKSSALGVDTSLLGDDVSSNPPTSNVPICTVAITSGNENSRVEPFPCNPFSATERALNSASTFLGPTLPFLTSSVALPLDNSNSFHRAVFGANSTETDSSTVDGSSSILGGPSHQSSFPALGCEPLCYYPLSTSINTFRSIQSAEVSPVKNTTPSITPVSAGNANFEPSGVSSGSNDKSLGIAWSSDVTANTSLSFPSKSCQDKLVTDSSNGAFTEPAQNLLPSRILSAKITDFSQDYLTSSSPGAGISATVNFGVSISAATFEGSQYKSSPLIDNNATKPVDKINSIPNKASDNYSNSLPNDSSSKKSNKITDNQGEQRSMLLPICSSEKIPTSVPEQSSSGNLLPASTCSKIICGSHVEGELNISMTDSRKVFMSASADSQKSTPCSQNNKYVVLPDKPLGISSAVSGSTEFKIPQQSPVDRQENNSKNSEISSSSVPISSRNIINLKPLVESSKSLLSATLSISKIEDTRLVSASQEIGLVNAGCPKTAVSVDNSTLNNASVSQKDPGSDKVVNQPATVANLKTRIDVNREDCLPNDSVISEKASTSTIGKNFVSGSKAQESSSLSSHQRPVAGERACEANSSNICVKNDVTDKTKKSPPNSVEGHIPVRPQQSLPSSHQMQNQMQMSQNSNFQNQFSQYQKSLPHQQTHSLKQTHDLDMQQLQLQQQQQHHMNLQLSGPMHHHNQHTHNTQLQSHQTHHHQQQQHEHLMGSNLYSPSAFDYSGSLYNRRHPTSPRGDSRHCYASSTYAKDQQLQNYQLDNQSALNDLSGVSSYLLDDGPDERENLTDPVRYFSVTHLVSQNTTRKQSTNSTKSEDKKSDKTTKLISAKKTESKSRGKTVAATDSRRRSPGRSHVSSQQAVMWHSSKQSSSGLSKTPNYSTEAILSSQNYMRSAAVAAPPQPINHNYTIGMTQNVYQYPHQMKNFSQNTSVPFGYSSSSNNPTDACTPDYNFQLHQAAGPLGYASNVSYMAPTYPYQAPSSSGMLSSDLMTGSHPPPPPPPPYPRFHEFPSDQNSFPPNPSFPFAFDTQDMCGGSSGAVGNAQYPSSMLDNSLIGGSAGSNHRSGPCVPFSPLRMMERQQSSATSGNMTPAAQLSSSLSNFNLTSIIPEIDNNKVVSDNPSLLSTPRSGSLASASSARSSTVASADASYALKLPQLDHAPNKTHFHPQIANSMNNFFSAHPQVGFGLNASSLPLPTSSFSCLNFPHPDHP
ncbi:uncharacterized threonine-rich GPI-anchored glycoprotein PJ4664.02 [Hyalella azteca]|uniref:Uncharacterized threonine-rich GPI-anchored glycoprotein PJ4664.02 n=1 Tax=Hyalella azteca TaxID=294128 RepID=A0A8B7NXN7_HYAAZ|nr:uncharacterized threonine-rich GPI-anchored glycoprotein PJ4664.02 [Hyalella azteca]